MRRSTRWGIGFGILLVTAAVAHTVTWFVVTRQIEAGIAPFVAAASAQGWHLEGAAPERAGWPWAASARIPSVVATRAFGTSTLRWRAESVLLTVSPLDPGQLAIAAEGNQTIEAGGRSTPLHAAEATMHVPLDGNGPIAILVQHLSAGTETSGFVIGKLTGRITPTTLLLKASGANTVPPLPPPFAAPAAITLRLLTEKPFPPLQTPAASAAAWRDAGGTLAIPDLVLLWGPLTASGSGAIRLDADLQPEGEANLHILGAASVLDAAAKAGLLRPNPAAAARAVLGLLSLAAAGGPISLPVTLRDSTLTAAQFPLVRLQKLVWTQP